MLRTNVNVFDENIHKMLPKGKMQSHLKTTTLVI